MKTILVALFMQGAGVSLDAVQFSQAEAWISAMPQLHAESVRWLKCRLAGPLILLQITSANVRSILRKYQMPLTSSRTTPSMDKIRPGR